METEVGAQAHRSQIVNQCVAAEIGKSSSPMQIILTLSHFISSIFSGNLVSRQVIAEENATNRLILIDEHLEEISKNNCSSLDGIRTEISNLEGAIYSAAISLL